MEDLVDRMAWRPVTIEEVKKIVEKDLLGCIQAQRAIFDDYSITPCAVPIVRYGKLESVVVVARAHDKALYWEDVEEGFNVSPIAPDGTILEHGCNQDSLCVALSRLTKTEK